MTIQPSARCSPHRASRRSLALLAVLLSALAIAPANVAKASDSPNWIATWTASPQSTWGSDFVLPTKIPATLENQTIRQTVRVSLGGRRVRVVLSNQYGDQPLAIGEAHVALAGAGARIIPASDRKLTFGGQTSIAVPPGEPAVSDPVDLPVEALASLSVSVFLPRKTPLTTFHWDGKQTATIGHGNVSAAAHMQADSTTDTRIFLSGILVDSPTQKGAVVVIGDSITDGAGASLDSNHRWPDFLAHRLAARQIAVLNAGISGARVLSDKMGANALARFDRDVLSQPHVKTAIVLIGINDISWPGTAFAPDAPPLAVEALTDGYRQLVAQARSRNVRVIGATLTPFEGALSGTPLEGYFNADKEKVRQQVNAWIRSSGAFDAVIDFDAVLRDPAHPTRLRSEYDSGDHLHPGDKGNEAMAEAVDLDALLAR